MDVACFDVTVLGAGVQGSATAYYLAKKAGIKKVLLLEQVGCCELIVVSIAYLSYHNLLPSSSLIA